MFAAVMFPESENASEMLKIGRDTVEMNLRNAVFADGGSDEDSPSYNNFIARLYLEDEGLYNDLMYFHDKVIANNITEYELVTVMLIGEDLRETDASVANCLDIDCLELISLLREANGLREVG
jgi:hypothetical protein